MYSNDTNRRTAGMLGRRLNYPYVHTPIDRRPRVTMPQDEKRRP